MKILGHELPPLLVSELQAERPVLSQDRLAALKPLLPHVEGVQPKLYSFDYMIEVNRLWESKNSSLYVGRSNGLFPPGDIDPRKAVIIGEAEPDSPIALDYRTTPPRVIYMGDVKHEICWLELARSYEDLVDRLRVGPSAAK